MPPPLFDLTSLQREANARFGLSANRTVQIAQALYERHKVLTYPRTDSRALPEDYVNTVKDSLRMLTGTDYAPFAGAILEKNWVRPDKRIFNNAKVSDHFAIIPTTEAPRRLNEIEQKIYDLVARRFLAIFYPAAEFLETTRITRVESEPFKTTGKVMVKAGWLEVHGRDTGKQGDETTLAPLRAVDSVDAAAPPKADAPENAGGNGAVQTDDGGVPVETLGIEVKQNQTRPPARFTEATLLGAMEGAGRLVTDEDLRAAMAGKGLGTSATRASIIEGLLDEDYLVREGKELHATSKAFMLMELLNGLGVRELTRPELTGNWEYQLFQMQGGKKSRDEFMGEIAQMTRQIVDRARQYEHDTIPGDFGVLSAPCPRCKGEVHERYRNFQCVNCDFSLPKILAGRLLSAEETEKLIEDGQVGPLQGFRSRQGRPFAAVLKLSPESRIAFDFGNESRNGDGDGEPAADFTGQEPLGQCPRCVGRVFELPMRYVCENAVGDARTCEFSSGRIILRQEVAREQMVKLLTEGKTDLLPGFVSSRTGRSFKAFLVMQEGKVGFEFEPRAPRKKADAPANKPAVKADFTAQEPVGKCPPLRQPDLRVEFAVRVREVPGGPEAVPLQVRCGHPGAARGARPDGQAPGGWQDRSPDRLRLLQVRPLVLRLAHPRRRRQGHLRVPAAGIDPAHPFRESFRLRLPERGHPVHAALEQHALLVDDGIPEPVGRLLAGVLGPHAVDVLAGPLAAGLALPYLVHHRGLDAHPVVGVLGVHQQERDARVLAYPAALGPVRGRVHQHLVAVVVEPHGREVHPPVGAGETERDRDGHVQQLLVGGVEILEARGPGPLADGELALLQAPGHVLELRYGEF